MEISRIQKYIGMSGDIKNTFHITSKQNVELYEIL